MTPTGYRANALPRGFRCCLIKLIFGVEIINILFDYNVYLCAEFPRTIDPALLLGPDLRPLADEDSPGLSPSPYITIVQQNILTCDIQYWNN